MTKAPKPTWKQRLAALLSNGPEVPADRTDFARLKGQGEIEFAFASGGVDYFKFTNEQHIPALRAFAAKDVWAELSFKMTAQHLAATLKSVIALLNQGKGIHAGLMVQTVIDRLEWVTNIDLLYKLASIVYFDARENFLSWDPVYNERKTTAWKLDDKLDSFFLKSQMIAYLPFGDTSTIDLEAFTTAQRKADLSHQTAVSSIVSKDSEAKELSTFLASSMEVLRTLTRSPGAE